MVAREPLSALAMRKDSQPATLLCSSAKLPDSLRGGQDKLGDNRGDGHPYTRRQDLGASLNSRTHLGGPGASFPTSLLIRQLQNNEPKSPRNGVSQVVCRSVKSAGLNSRTVTYKWVPCSEPEDEPRDLVGHGQTIVEVVAPECGTSSLVFKFNELDLFHPDSTRLRPASLARYSA